MNTNKSLKEEIETMSFVLNKDKENYNLLNAKMKTIESKYDNLDNANKNEIGKVYENLYEMDCRIIHNN